MTFVGRQAGGGRRKVTVFFPSRLTLHALLLAPYSLPEPPTYMMQGRTDDHENLQITKAFALRWECPNSGKTCSIKRKRTTASINGLLEPMEIILSTMNCTKETVTAGVWVWVSFVRSAE